MNPATVAPAPQRLGVRPLDLDSSNAIEWVRPEPATDYERGCIDELEPGDYEIYDEKLANICDEAREIFSRSGVSSMLRSGDVIVGIYTANGDLATASCGTYLHAVSGCVPIKFVVHKYADDPTVGVREGDIFYCNEAIVGGIHNCDQMAFMPVFHHGELIAWVASALHQHETGGTEPGGMSLIAKSRYDEGLKLTPIKIGEGFRLRRDMMDMMVSFIGRAPRMQEIDMRARVTAIDRLRIRLEEVAAEKSERFVHGLLRRLVIEAEQAARNRIARWADGTYRATAFCDSIGREPGLIRGTLAAVKKGDTITFDFTGSSPENDSSYNCFPHIVAAHAAIYTFAYPFHDLPVSNGAFAPFEWVVPEGSCFNAAPDAAVGNSPTLCSIVLSLTALVFAKMMYGSMDADQIGAPNGNTGTEICFGGVNQYDVPVVDLDPSTMNNEGQGARPDMDGVHAYGFPWGHAGRSPDVEDFEDQYAFLRLFHRLRPDSGGFGKYQGGAGAETALVVHHVPSTTFLSIGKNANITVAVGLFGGYPAAACPGAWWRASGIWDMMDSGHEIPASSIELIEMAKEMGGDVLVEHPNRVARLARNGDILVQLASGGGGYGDPLERAPEAVVADLTAALITPWTAEHLYGVCVDPETLELDVEATEAARAAVREERLRLGQPWDAFQREWSELRPVAEATKHFGSWPDGVLDAPIVRM